MKKNVLKTLCILTSVLSLIFLCILIHGVREKKQMIENIHKLNTQIKELNNENNSKEDKLKELEKKIEQYNIDVNLYKEKCDLLTKKLNKLKKQETTNKTVVFNKLNLMQKSGVDTERLNMVLKETSLHDLGKYYVDAENKYGINALFLVALTAEESGWGNSSRAKEQNNLSGYAVYSDESAGKSFDSKYSNILTTAKLLVNDYLKKDGKYYKGKDIFSINETYCPMNGYEWANNIVSIANKLVKDINEL